MNFFFYQLRARTTIAISRDFQEDKMWLNGRFLVKFTLIYHVLCSDYAEFVLRDIGDITITHIRTSCKKCLSVSGRVQKMHINDVAMKKYVTTNKSIVKYFRILSSFTSAILA
jgi:hypothetical protein